MKITNESKIGIFVILVLLGLLLITWKTVGYEFIPDGYRLRVLFKDIDGVERNAPVTLNGLEVGRVDDIRILYDDATRVQLTLWIAKKAQLHEGAKAFVKNMGFLGEKYVALTSGEDGTPFLPENAVIHGEQPVDFQDIMAKGEVIAGHVQEITRNIEERLRINSEAIDRVIANLNTTVNNMASISGQVKDKLVSNEDRIDDTIQNLNLTSKNLEEMSFDLKENPWKLLYKPRTKDK